MGKKDTTATKIGAMLLVLLVGAVVLDFFDMVDVPFVEFKTTGPSAPSGPSGPSGPSAPAKPGDFPTAIVTTKVAAWDSLDISTARTVGTDINCLWFRYSAGWIKVAAGDAQDVTLQKRHF